MRVTCNCLKDFIDDLKARLKNGSDCVLQKTVRLSISKRPIDHENPSKATKFSVTFQASAIIELEGDCGEYLLQMGFDCGIDYEDATQEKLGSEKAAIMRKELAEFCELNGLILGPGVIEP